MSSLDGPLNLAPRGSAYLVMWVMSTIAPHALPCLSFCGCSIAAWSLAEVSVDMRSRGVRVESSIICWGVGVDEGKGEGGVVFMVRALAAL